MSRRLLTVHLAALLGLSTATPAFADGPPRGSHVYQGPSRTARPAAPVAAPVASGQVARVVLTADQTAASLDLAKGKSAIVELPADVRDLLVTSPTVADAVLRDKRRVYIVGLAEGVTDAAFFDEAGRRILSLSIKVSQPVDQLADTLQRVLPEARIEVRPIRDSVVLSGTVRTPADSDAAARIAAQYVGGADKVLNMLAIAGKDQVMLQVRIVEVQRNIIKQLGVSTDNLLNDGFKSYSLGRENTFGVNGALVGGGGACYARNNLRTTNASTSSNSSSQTSASSSTGVPGNGTSATVSNAVSAAASAAWSAATGNNLNACLAAFERVGLVRTLAEPNLTAVSGEAGQFLVGGEFPVPTGSDDTGRVSIEFKPYGVGLGYTPVVMSGGRISLKLSTEVSELSSLGAFTLSNGSASRSLTVPGLSVRRAETTVELPSGGSLMIAGLLQQTSRQTVDSLPGMTNMPILGALFRSRDFLNGETELVIIVTPYIVDPTKPRDLQTPADGLDLAGDMSTVLLGRLNQVVKAPPGANAGRAYQGPVGYVIEQDAAMTRLSPVKTVLSLALLAGLTACATTPAAPPAPRAATETQTWAERVTVTPASDEILLASRATGLSANQGAALEALMGRWLQAEARELVVTAPAGAGGMAVQVRERLITLGAPAAQVRIVGLDPAAPQDPVIRVGFVRYEAHAPKCGQAWESLTATRDNRAYENFGCAVAANMAAQVANPEDLLRPRETTPASASRRDAVAGKYRRGEVTSAARDDNASGALAKAIP